MGGIARSSVSAAGRHPRCERAPCSHRIRVRPAASL